MKTIKPKKGRLLISEPSMLDANFKRSVLLLTEHNDNESIAFILNQPTKIKIHDLFEDFPSFDANVHIGGPVEKNTLHYIHSLGDKIDNSIPISDNLYWSGSFDTLKKLIKNKLTFGLLKFITKPVKKWFSIFDFGECSLFAILRTLDQLLTARNNR